MKLTIFKEINDNFDDDNEKWHGYFDRKILELLKQYAPEEVYKEAEYVYKNNEFWYS